MARQIYRVYLYIVSIALLVLAAVGLALLLNTLFAFTPLRGSFRGEPTQQELVQSLIFAVTAWIIAAVLGFVHLRLIQHDIAEFGNAALGGVRAFFLNSAEAIAALVAALSAASAFSMLGYAQPSSSGDSSGLFAMALAGLLVAGVLEFERRRFAVAPGAAIVFQRLHVYGVPLILLVVTTLGYWGAAVLTTVQDLLMRANIYSVVDANACSLYGSTVNGICSLPNAGFLWLAVLMPVAGIVFYSLTAWNDLRSKIRTVAHIASLSLGVGAVLFGLIGGIELLLRAVFGVPVFWGDIVGPWNPPFDFISPISIGVLIVVAYGLWLRAEKAYLPLGAQTTSRAVEAATAVIFAVAFWWGIGSIAYTALQWFGASAGESVATRWAGALALTLAGAAYIPFAIHLRQTTTTESSVPRRAFILALLAGGIIAGAVGLTMTLYTLGTSVFGAPLSNADQVVRAGVATLLVGVILVVSYGWTAQQERSITAIFKRLRQAPAALKAPAMPAQSPIATEATEATAATAPDETAAIEQVLQAYETHSIDLHEAAERVKALAHAGR
jgi:hypothetical protein